MKKLLIYVLIVLTISFYSVSADMSFSDSSLDFGVIDWDSDSTKTLTITNSGSTTLTGITLASSHNQSYDVEFNKNNFNLDVGNSTDVQITATLEDKPKTAVGYTFFSDLSISNNEDATTSNIPMYLTASERFFIKSVDIKVGLESELDIENNSKIKQEAQANDEILFTIEIENAYHYDDSEYEIEDVSIKAIIKEIDEGDDIETEIDTEFSIDAGDSKTKELTISIPNSVQGDTYAIEIIVEGKNIETKERYETKWNLRLEVSKKKHDIQITDIELRPSEIECDASGTTLNIKLKNYGEKDEDYVKIEIKNTDLNLYQDLKDIKINSDSRYEDDILITLLDEFSVAGTYPLTVNVYYDDDKLDDQEIIDLTILECETQVQEDKTTIQNISTANEIINNDSIESNTTNTEENNINNNQIAKQIPTVQVKNSFKGLNKYYYYPIIVLIILISGVLIYSISLKK
jgi:hypothetical protein